MVNRILQDVVFIDEFRGTKASCFFVTTRSRFVLNSDFSCAARGLASCACAKGGNSDG